jgi:hypothetical protein
MLVGLVVLLCVVGYALPRIILRFTKAPEASKNTRIEFALAAKMMANEHRLGVGANNYSVHSAEYWNRVKEHPVEHGGIVETVYLLVAAECGWWGLAVMLIWFLYYYLSAIISMFALRRMPCSGIVIGIFAGLTCNYWHSTLEWSLKQTNNFGGLMTIYAITGVIAVNRKNIKAAYRRSLIHEAERPKKKKRRRFVPQMPVPPDFPDAPAAEEPAFAGFPGLTDPFALTTPEPAPMPEQSVPESTASPEAVTTDKPAVPEPAGTLETPRSEEAETEATVKEATAKPEATVLETASTEAPAMPEPAAEPSGLQPEPPAAAHLPGESFPPQPPA